MKIKPMFYIKSSVKKYLKIFHQAFPVTQSKQAQTKNKWFNE